VADLRLEISEAKKTEGEEEGKIIGSGAKTAMELDNRDIR
jgi:hypothetical protein